MNELSFHLLRPWCLLALLPALLLGWQWWRRHATSNQWYSVIDPELLPSLLEQGAHNTRHWKQGIMLAGWVLASLALAGPSFEKREHEALQQADALVVLLDLSPSMLARDVAPNRLRAAHYKILDLLKQRREGYTGLIAYSGSAHVVAPLSDDANTVAALVNTLSPEIMPTLGSQAEDAIAAALQLLENSGFARGRLLLVTDGVVEGAATNIAQQLRGKAMELHVIGVGTTEGGPIALANGQYLKDDQGQILINRLEEAALVELAEKNNGQYHRLQMDDSDIKALLVPPAWLSAFGNGEQRDASHRIEFWQDSGYWLALLCLPLLLSLFRRGALLCLLPACCLLLTSPDSRADSLPWSQQWRDWWQTRDQQAASALAAGDAAQAAHLFENPEWKAYAEYQNRQPAEAAQHFAESDSARSHYNRGNALARSGDLAGAIGAYDEALKQQADLTDARFNRELVQKLLEQQQQQQQQSDKPQQQSGEQKPFDDQQAQQSGEQQQSDNQQQSDSQQQSSNQQTQQTGDPQTQQTGEQQQSDNQQQSGTQQPQSGEQQQSAGQQQSTDQQQQTAEQSADEKQRSAEAEKTAEQGRVDNDSEPADKAAENVGTTEEKTQQNPDSSAKAVTDAEARAEQERQQATQQWLRKVPDDPGGLLKNKFEYYYQLNRREELRKRRSGEQDTQEQRW